MVFVVVSELGPKVRRAVKGTRPRTDEEFGVGRTELNSYGSNKGDIPKTLVTKEKNTI